MFGGRNQERSTGRYPGGNLLETTHPGWRGDEIPCKQLGEVSQLLALVLIRRGCLGCVWNEWKRTFPTQQRKTSAGPAVCEERRT